MKATKRKRRPSWRCFHCNELFRTRQSAQDHFGPSMQSTPICQIKPDHIRALEKELASYHQEDSVLERQIRSIQSQHQQALMRAEESGYAKGLRDGRLLPANESSHA